MKVKEYIPSSYNLEAYLMLYELENHIKDIIVLNKKYYDPEEIPPLLTLTKLYHLLQKQHNRGNRAISHTNLMFIEKAIPIRNKVCHMEEITEEEFDTIALSLKLMRIAIKNRSRKYDL
ncbi:hypothetical protein [Alkalihalophilus marmarensis]|uniref:Uncharacterized protein n=1 Tax=Alkalihalophilus marmarensis DSM 21297 TaxID=1188261 RepID=U6STX7_9BACI|nr:hypothetical protein [Alkalihalophilus marmarensis]ERN54330.1 hypothetical protein A33I_07890 [Alkalihalophilus marmarensis DSM 21297]